MPGLRAGAYGRRRDAREGRRVTTRTTDRRHTRSSHTRIKALQDIDLDVVERHAGRQPDRTVPAGPAGAARHGRRSGLGACCSSRRSPRLTGGVVGARYAASKAGLHGLTHHLAPRVAADGVTVNALAPALIGDTKMFPVDPETAASPVRIPVGRAGRPAEVADMAIAMLRNGYLTDKVVPLTAGFCRAD